MEEVSNAPRKYLRTRQANVSQARADEVTEGRCTPKHEVRALKPQNKEADRPNVGLVASVEFEAAKPAQPSATAGKHPF